jgi:general secretion pathway protein J
MRRRLAPGFTLLEIVVALAVFGFLLAGLSQTVRFGLTAWRQQARLAEGKTDLEAVDRTVRSIIQNLAPGGGTDKPAVIGSATSLSGVTMLRLPGAGLTATPTEAELALSGSRLVLRWRPYHHGNLLRPPPPARETELIGGVAHLGFSYWLPSGVWSSSWSEPDLPLLIRVRVGFRGQGSVVGGQEGDTFTDERAKRWPDIVAAPLLSRP